MRANEPILQSSEVLILPDGRILAHNITPEMAAILIELQPDNHSMQQRASEPPKPLQ
jgi:hypothetical protein